MAKRLIVREVVELCQNGKTTEARTKIADILAAPSAKPKAEQRLLLDALLQLEIHADRVEAALRVLKRRRALGYRKVEQRMDAALHAATLLHKVGNIVAARAELLEIMQDQRSLRWDGLLPALSLYVDLDEECQRQMNSVLIKASKAVINKFGIPLPMKVSTRTVTRTIKNAHEMYRLDSRAYSGLICRAMTEKTQAGRERLIKEIRKYSNGKRVGFFNEQAVNLLDKLTSKS